MEKNSANQNSRSLMKDALLKLERLQSKLNALERIKNEPIAIIGLGCRFPKGAGTPEEFWQLLRNGVDAIIEVPSDRWDIDAYYDPDPDMCGKIYTRHASFLEEVDQFDSRFFNISPREAETLDPQQRLLLEIGWETLEYAGISPVQLINSKTGVFIGIMNQDYSRLNNDLNSIDMHSGTGNAISAAAGRLSHFFGFQGPSMTLDTACSSSLVSVHLACQSLRMEECNLALAGGVNLILSPVTTVAECRANMLSPNGRCRTFDAEADGFVRGEGCGLILLKRLSDAVADGDNILALIRGSAVNHDGSSGGLTVPNGLAQEKLIRQALANAKVEASQVSYVEAHGTGTPLGDPIELSALGKVFGKDRLQNNPLVIGSVKSNLGHLEGAAGIAGLIKVILALQNKKIPPNLHCKRPNPNIPWNDLPVKIPTELTPWLSKDSLRIAGVSSFGFSGTNAHVLLEEGSNLPGSVKVEISNSQKSVERPLYLMTFSAKTEDALKQLASQYKKHLAANPDLVLGNVCFTANTGRSHFKHRLSIVTASSRELSEQLATFIVGNESYNIFNGSVTKKTGIAFLFTGEGSQYADMGRQLYDTQVTFRQTIDHCAAILNPYLEIPLLEVLYSATEENSLLNETAYTQPALFVLEYALAELWKSWGIEPTVVMGHSIGEYVAACIAGVFSLEDALKLVVTRAKLMQALPNDGEMVAVLASEVEVRAAIGDYGQKIAFAAINIPKQVVISGHCKTILSVCSILETAGIETKLLPVSHAFHSPLMEPMLAEFAVVASEVTYHQPTLPLVSNTTGKRVDNSIATANYWVNHVRQPVKFAQSMETLYQEGYEIFLEIGPKAILLGMGKQCLPNYGIWLSSLQSAQEDWLHILQSLAELYVQGVEVNWLEFYQDYSHSRVLLPTYPFQRQRYWMETEETVNKTTIKDSFYQIQWKPLINTQSQTNIEPSHWLIFADTIAVGKKLAHQLQQQGSECSLVYRGDRYQKLEEGVYQLNPTDTQEFEQLIKAIKENTKLPLLQVVHLWSLDIPNTSDLTVTSIEQSQSWGCGSVLCLVKALTKTKSLAKLWLVTRGTQSVTSNTEEVSAAASSLWGMGRVISLEHPQLWGGLVDLDLQTPELEIEALLELLVSHDQREDHLALREGTTYVARLVKQSLQSSEYMSLRDNASYLITGGLGALGLHTARWMVSQGARHLVLTGRRQPSAEALQTIEELQNLGAQILVACGDISHKPDVTKIFAEIEASLPSLGGVIHAAGVLDDSLLHSMSWEQFTRVMAPKVQGAWHLHNLTRDKALDFFVCFSSMASLLGSPGQGNYAAANAFMDALVHHRRVMGLPSLSINWGPWAQGGMAKNLEEQMIAKGITPLTSAQGLEILGQLLKQSLPQVGVLPVQWSVFLSQLSVANQMPLLSEMLKESGTQPKIKLTNAKLHKFLEKLKAASPRETEKLLITYIQNEISQVLRMSTSEIDMQQPLNTMGIDSLMAVELRNRLQTDLAVNVPIVKFIEDISIVDLGAEVNKRLTQIDSIQTIESENNEQILLSDVKDSNWIEGTL